MDKKLNMYQKIAILQDKVKVTKSSYCEFGKFKYRSIQDIFTEIKPAMKELNLIIIFTNGKLDGDKLSLEIKVIDVEQTDLLIESGEIYIDRSKAKMDLSQKVLSAKTFLKKSLLEDLLLICENDDPDGHDNTIQQANETLSKLKNMLYILGDKDENKMINLLEEHTAFQGKDGKQIKGVRDFTKLSQARINTTYGKLSKEYPELHDRVNKKKGAEKCTQ